VYSSGLDPCVLIWKDAFTTKYIDDDGSQYAALKVACYRDNEHKEGEGCDGSPSDEYISLRTLDDFELASWSRSLFPQFKDGDIVKCELQFKSSTEISTSPSVNSQTDCVEVLIQAPNGSIVNCCLYTTFIKTYSANKASCDPWSKILFKYLFRTSPLTIHHIAAALTPVTEGTSSYTTEEVKINASTSDTSAGYINEGVNNSERYHLGESSILSNDMDM
jgi:hypothetical protein